MSRIVHKATDRLTPEAWRVMIAGFRDKLTAKMIAARVEQETGEKVTERTVSSRMREWHLDQTRRKAAREQMLALVEAMKEGNWSAAEMIQALATDALMMNPDGLTTASPLKVQAQNLKAEELRIKREAVEVRKREMEINARKLALLEERERRAVALLDEQEKKASENGGMVSAEDLRRVRELYGLPAAEARA